MSEQITKTYLEYLSTDFSWELVSRGIYKTLLSNFDEVHINCMMIGNMVCTPYDKDNLGSILMTRYQYYVDDGYLVIAFGPSPSDNEYNIYAAKKNFKYSMNLSDQVYMIITPRTPYVTNYVLDPSGGKVTAAGGEFPVQEFIGNGKYTVEGIGIAEITKGSIGGAIEGGVVYKGKLDFKEYNYDEGSKVLQLNSELEYPIYSGYRYNISGGPIIVDGIKYENGDFLIFNTNVEEGPATIDDVDLYNSQDTDVVHRDQLEEGLNTKVDKLENIVAIDNKLVKITTNTQGQVISTSVVTKSDIPNIDISQVNNLGSTLNTKVDKVEGKGLSTNDFDNNYKSKLDGIESNAQVNTIESISINGVDTQISQDKNVDIVVNKPLLSEFITDGTTLEFCRSIAGSSNTSAGSVYIGEVSLLDSPMTDDSDSGEDLTGRVIVKVLAGSLDPQSNKVIILEMFNPDAEIGHWYAMFTGNSVSGIMNTGTNDCPWQGLMSIKKNSADGYIPISDYDAASKKYVDDSISALNSFPIGNELVSLVKTESDDPSSPLNVVTSSDISSLWDALFKLSELISLDTLDQGLLIDNLRTYVAEHSEITPTSNLGDIVDYLVGIIELFVESPDSSPVTLSIKVDSRLNSITRESNIEDIVIAIVDLISKLGGKLYQDDRDPEYVVEKYIDHINDSIENTELNYYDDDGDDTNDHLVGIDGLGTLLGYDSSTKKFDTKDLDSDNTSKVLVGLYQIIKNMLKH